VLYLFLSLYSAKSLEAYLCSATFRTVSFFGSRYRFLPSIHVLGLLFGILGFSLRSSRAMQYHSNKIYSFDQKAREGC
jgi:hypothetical protein